MHDAGGVEPSALSCRPAMLSPYASAATLTPSPPSRVQDAGGVEPLVKVLSSSVGDGAQAAAGKYSRLDTLVSVLDTRGAVSDTLATCAEHACHRVAAEPGVLDTRGDVLATRVTVSDTHITVSDTPAAGALRNLACCTRVYLCWTHVELC